MVRDDTPVSEPVPPTLFELLPLWKHRFAALLAENGCFLLMRMRWLRPGIDAGYELMLIIDS